MNKSIFQTDILWLLCSVAFAADKEARRSRLMAHLFFLS